jgi:tRNA 2-thiouridine synthesizing protein B
MILHTLNATPASAAFRDCIRMLQPECALVLMGSGVYAAIEGTEALASLLATGAKIYLLRADANAAGVVAASSIEEMDMDGLVTLTEQYPRQLAWY